LPACFEAVGHRFDRVDVVVVESPKGGLIGGAGQSVEFIESELNGPTPRRFRRAEFGPEGVVVTAWTAEEPLDPLPEGVSFVRLACATHSWLELRTGFEVVGHAAWSTQFAMEQTSGSPRRGHSPR
jgi:hypothetical protein